MSDEIKVVNGVSQIPGAVKMTDELKAEIDKVEKELLGKGVALSPKEVKIVDVTSMQGEDAQLVFEWSFHVYYRDANGVLWAGDFTAKRLTNRELTRVGIERARMCGGVALNALDDNTAFMTNMLSYLNIAITKAPKWWMPEEMYNVELVQKVHNFLLDKESSFR